MAPATGALSGCDNSFPGRVMEPSTGGRKAVPPGNGGGGRAPGPVTLSGGGKPMSGGPVPICGGASGRGGGIPINGGGGRPSGGRIGA